MARVIGEAAIRLTVDGTGIGANLRKTFERAARDAFRGGMAFKELDNQAEESTVEVENRYRGMFGRILSMGQGFASSIGGMLAAGAKIALIGTAAAGAVAGVTQLFQGVLALVGILGQASGAAALLPAAFAGFLAVGATIKLGVQGIGDSFKALASGDVAKFNESLKGLAPSAREFALAVRDVKPAFDGMQLEVQQTLFKGFGEQVRILGRTLLPTLRTGLVGIASELNIAGIGIAKFASDGEVVGQLGLFFKDIRASVAALAPSVTSLMSAFLDIGQVGATFLPGLANGFSKVTEQFANFVRESAASGALAEFIQGGIDALKQLGQIAKNVFGIFGDLMNASTISGGGLLNNLVLITDQIRAFTSSAAGSEAINTFFKSMSQVISALLPVVLQLAGVFATTLLPIIAQLATTIGPALQPVIAALGTALQAAAPGIQALGEGFAALLRGIAPALPAIGQLANVLGQSLGQVMTALAPILSQVATVLAGVLAQAIPPLVPIIGQLAKLFGDVLTAVLPLLPPLIQLAAAIVGPLITVIQALVPPFQQLIQQVLKVAEPLIPVIADAFTQLATALSPLAGAIGQAVVAIFTALSPAIQPLAEAFVALVQALLPLIGPITQIIQIATPIIALFLQMQASILSFILSAVTPLINIFGVLVTITQGTFSQILSVVQNVVNGVTGFFSNLMTNVNSTWTGITGTISGAVGRVRDFVTSGFNNVVNTIRNALSSAVSAVSSGIGNVISFFSGLPGRILGAIGNLGSLLFNVGRNVLEGLINGISSMVGAVVRRVADIGKSIINSITGALGISSPSKEMAKVGVFVGEGLIVGMDRIAPKVASAASDLADTLKDSVGQDLVLTGGAAGGDGASASSTALSLHQTNVMLPGTDVRQFASTVLQRANTDFLAGASSLPVQRKSVQAGVDDGFLGGVNL